MENPLARALVAGHFKPGDRITAATPTRVGDARVLDRRARRSSRTARRRAMRGPARPPKAIRAAAGGRSARRWTCRPDPATARRRRTGQLRTRAASTTSSIAWRRSPEPLPRRRAETLDPGPRRWMDLATARPRWPIGDRVTRPAGVLALLYPDADGIARVVLTERASRDGHHSGEVSFPGGKAEADDADIAATALREAAEEVGLDALTRRASASSALLDRFVDPGQRLRRDAGRRAWRRGARSWSPRRPRWPGSSSHRWRRSCPARRSTMVERDHRRVAVPLRRRIDVDGLSVWGATARILSQLGAVLGRDPTVRRARRSRDPGRPAWTVDRPAAPSPRLGPVIVAPGGQREGLAIEHDCVIGARRTRRRTRASPSARSRRAWVTSAGQRTASPAATLARSSPTPHPAATLDDDEPGRVRVGVRLDPGAARERQLADHAAGVGVDDLAGQAAGVPTGRPAADGRHRTGGSRWAVGPRRLSGGGACRRPPTALGGSSPRVRELLRGGSTLPRELAARRPRGAAGTAGTGPRRASPGPMISVTRIEEEVEDEDRPDDQQAERDQPGPPDPLPHVQVRRVAVERPRPERCTARSGRSAGRAPRSTSESKRSGKLRLLNDSNRYSQGAASRGTSCCRARCERRSGVCHEHGILGPKVAVTPRPRPCAARFDPDAASPWRRQLDGRRLRVASPALRREPGWDRRLRPRPARARRRALRDRRHP